MFNCTIKVMNNLKNESPSVGSQVEKDYKTQPDYGRVAEERALHLTNSFLEGVDKAWLADKASILDTAHKVDLVVEVGKECTGIQVKTSEEGQSKHEDLATYFQGAYGYPDCVVAGPQVPGWKVLFRLCELTGLSYNERAHVALAFAHYYKGTTQNKRIFKRPGDLIALGLASPHPEGLKFISDPPPL